MTRDSQTQFDSDHPEVIALLAARGAESIPRSGGTLLAHLRRTARRLESWGGGRELVVAGLCHAAYGTQGFPTPLFGVANRAVLRDAIGDEAEAIVYAYCALDRAHQRAALDADSSRVAASVRPREMRDRFSGEYWAAPEHMRRQLAELSVANELDVVEHGQLSGDELQAIARMIDAAGPWLSQAAWSAAVSESRVRDALVADAAPSGDAEIAYRDLGSSGQPVLLWHGGGSPELTWSRQHALATSLALRIPWRRGFSPSASATRADWGADVLDLLRVMPERAHVVAHSYGGVSAMVAATIAPERFGSLVVLEAPLWSLTPDDVELQQLAALGRAFANGAPEARAAFLALAALPNGHPQTARTERLARNVRDPGEAHIDIDRLRASGLRMAIGSGAHNGAIERSSDALSERLGAERWVLPGAGHAVPRQLEFNDRLRAFVGAG
jgi:pimeloyl-ACP methyl ester carboxylesterase